MTEVKFISFGGPSSNYHRAVNRIIHEANNTKLFTSVKGYTDIDLKNDNIFWSNHGKFLENNKRGYGYWLWKPYLIKKNLDTMNEDDILFYADAGCHFELNKPKQFMIDRINHIKKEKKIIGCFTCPEISYNKMDLIKYLNMENYILNSPASTSQHSITNIKSIDNAIYGVKNYKKDVTHIVQSRLCSEQKSAIERNITYSLKINGSYYKTFRITNKQLKFPDDDKEILNKIKTLTIKYINTENKTLTYKYEDKEPISLTDIKNIISVIYGVDTYNKDITTRIKEKFLKKHEVIEKRNLDSEEKTQSELIEEKKEIIHDIIKGKRYIAVHFRYRDKKTKGGPEKKLRDIKNKIKETGISAIFVATDCPTFFDYLVKQLDSKTTVFRYTNPPTKGINIHYNSDFKQGENLYKTLLDIYTCKNAHTFIPSITSGFSKLVYEDI